MLFGRLGVRHLKSGQSGMEPEGSAEEVAPRARLEGNTPPGYGLHPFRGQVVVALLSRMCTLVCAALREVFAHPKRRGTGGRAGERAAGGEGRGVAGTRGTSAEEWARPIEVLLNRMRRELEWVRPTGTFM